MSSPVKLNLNLPDMIAVETKLKLGTAAVLKSFGEQALEDIKDPSQTPVDTGRMRDSENFTVSSSILGAEIDIYAATEYSLIQHETLWFNHPNGGKAKFIEDPVNENRERYLKNAWATWRATKLRGLFGR